MTFKWEATHMLRYYVMNEILGKSYQFSLFKTKFCISFNDVWEIWFLTRNMFIYYMTEKQQKKHSNSSKRIFFCICGVSVISSNISITLVAIDEGIEFAVFCVGDRIRWCAHPAVFVWGKSLFVQNIFLKLLRHTTIVVAPCAIEHREQTHICLRWYISRTCANGRLMLTMSLFEISVSSTTSEKPSRNFAAWTASSGESGWGLQETNTTHTQIDTWWNNEQTSVFSLARNTKQCFSMGGLRFCLVASLGAVSLYEVRLYTHWFFDTSNVTTEIENRPWKGSSKIRMYWSLAIGLCVLVLPKVKVRSHQVRVSD